MSYSKYCPNRHIPVANTLHLNISCRKEQAFNAEGLLTFPMSDVTMVYVEYVGEECTLVCIGRTVIEEDWL